MANEAECEKPQVLCWAINFVLYFIEGYYKVALLRRMELINVVCYTSYIMLMVTWCRSECCVFQNLTSKPLTIESKNKCLVMF